MKTKDQIIQDMKAWYKLGDESLKYHVDEIAKFVVINPSIWTQHSHKKIVGDNDFTILAHTKGTYPNTGPVLSICIYYDE